MVIVVVFSARNVGFQAGQWAAIIVATIILAGLCVWIVSWEDSADDSSSEVVSPGPEQEPASAPVGRREAAPTEATPAPQARNGDV
jgi:hypothetical protein